MKHDSGRSDWTLSLFFLVLDFPTSQWEHLVFHQTPSFCPPRFQSLIDKPSAWLFFHLRMDHSFLFFVLGRISRNCNVVLVYPDFWKTSSSCVTVCCWLCIWLFCSSEVALRAWLCQKIPPRQFPTRGLWETVWPYGPDWTQSWSRLCCAAANSALLPAFHPISVPVVCLVLRGLQCCRCSFAFWMFPSKWK